MLEEKAAASGSSKAGDIEWLLQGTLYPDVVSTLGVNNPIFGIRHGFQYMIWLSRHVTRPDVRALK